MLLLRPAILLLMWVRSAAPAPRPVESTFDVQHIGVVTDGRGAKMGRGWRRGATLRHFKVATLRASFDQPLYVRRDSTADRAPQSATGEANTTAARQRPRRRIDLVPADT